MYNKKEEILKVRVKEQYLNDFESACKKYKIPYKKYPEPIFFTYKVICDRRELKGFSDIIISIETMPKIILD